MVRNPGHHVYNMLLEKFIQRGLEISMYPVQENLWLLRKKVLARWKNKFYVYPLFNKLHFTLKHFAWKDELNYARNEVSTRVKRWAKKATMEPWKIIAWMMKLSKSISFIRKTELMLLIIIMEKICENYISSKVAMHQQKTMEGFD